MTRAVRERILKDETGETSDHLHNHMTNCIHSENHMHNQSPITRDLVSLRRSMSLRDPSASLHSRRSSSLVDLPLNRFENDESIHQSDSGESDSRENLVKIREGYRQDESDDATSFSYCGDESHTRIGQHGNSLNRAKGRKSRGKRRSQDFIATRDDETQNEISLAGNSSGPELDDENRIDVPRNGCGIPLNWSRIHKAGRNLTCGLSESRLRRYGKERRFSDMNVTSEHSGSSTKSNRESSLPLLLEGSGSRGSVDRELGFVADDSSDGGSREKRQSSRRRCNNGHQNLTQKYKPRMFKDLVGQSLVARALSNAVAKRKVESLYLFYGPHGTGKTSCARIFARALNCTSLAQPKPCGVCSSCVSKEMGKNRNVMEIGAISRIDIESIINIFDERNDLRVRSQYRVVIFDECDNLSSEYWSAIMKGIDRAPRGVVFVLVCSSLDALPHAITSRCQKFFFPKIKDKEVIYTLQKIAIKENLEIDKDALKLIASRSDGSLRDAEMTLDQLSLLGKRISLRLVQELVGIISDEKLVDLLDLALSADTVKTVKNLRDIMESGVDPLALMSQLATVITDILAGSYDFRKGRSRRKFFRRQALSKQDMEKLRCALKTLSKAEKQLRVSNDKTTWLTAALLQLAPDQNYMVPSSSADTSLNHSPLVLDNDSHRVRPRQSNAEKSTFQAGTSASNDRNQRVDKVPFGGNFRREIDEIWLEVIEKIPISGVKELMYQEGKLISLSFGAGATVQLLFKSQTAKHKAEKCRLHILHAFESVLGSPVSIEIICESKDDFERGPILVPPPQQPSRLDVDPISEIVKIEDSPEEYTGVKLRGERAKSTSFDEIIDSLSPVRSEFSLGNVIHRTGASSQRLGWSKRKGVSFAEKLEQENLRLEPRSRRLLCWNPPRVTHRKHSCLKIRTKKSQSLLKYVSCGKCLSARSPR